MFKAWSGGRPPVAPEAKVRVQIRCRMVSDVREQNPTPARFWRWDHKGNAGDVVAYEVAK